MGVERTFETALLLYEHAFFFIETVAREQTQHTQAPDRKLAAFESSPNHFYAIG